MKGSDAPDETRRRLLRVLAAAPLLLGAPGLLGAACGGVSDPLTPTPACGDDDDDDPTPAQTEGPYFKASSPARGSLIEAGTTGTPLLLTGVVYSSSCIPVAGALLDFWHADAGGSYDNTGFRLRGHQFSDAQGVYRLETVVPGLYPGRTRHIHVKVQAPNRPVLTTQLYFPGEAGNASDGIFSADLLMALSDGGSGKAGVFNFVLALP